MAAPNRGVDRTADDRGRADPRTRTWHRLPPMPVASSGGTAVWDGSEVLFVGGTNAAGSPVATEAYNPATNRWGVGPFGAVS